MAVQRRAHFPRPRQGAGEDGSAPPPPAPAGRSGGRGPSDDELSTTSCRRRRGENAEPAAGVFFLFACFHFHLVFVGRPAERKQSDGTLRRFTRGYNRV